jgi:hypothetical protein
MIFRYPMSAHERRHGPRGYQDYRSYKPWLRDEFEFRCVYCLCRERWFPDGDANFSVDQSTLAMWLRNASATTTTWCMRVANAMRPNRMCGVSSIPVRSLLGRI